MTGLKVLHAMSGVAVFTKPELNEFLAEGKQPLRLGTVDRKGNPQIHPVWYYFHDDRLYLMTSKETRKLKNIKRKSTVYFSIDTDAMPYKGVKGKGIARIIKDPLKAVGLTEKIVTKYLGDSKSGYGKGLIDAAKSGLEVLIEITPLYYSAWDYSKRT